MSKIICTINVDGSIDRREFADDLVNQIGPDPSVLSMGIEFGSDEKPYRGALEICQEIVEAEQKLAILKAEITSLTGQDFETFMAGMRRLLAPADPPEYNTHGVCDTCTAREQWDPGFCIEQGHQG